MREKEKENNERRKHHETWRSHRTHSSPLTRSFYSVSQGEKDERVRNANVCILSASSACSACVWVWDFLR